MDYPCPIVTLQPYPSYFRPSLLLCNGPGTGLPLCLLASLLSTLSHVGVLSRERRCKVVFVESVCRVRTLSLTALVLYYSRMAHALLVQWPELQELYPRTRYIGRLM
jgi:beta-1,4-N-acetylglucosaminyltransferase